MLRVLPLTLKPRYYSVLNAVRTSSRSKQMSYSLGLPLQHFVYGNCNFQFVSSVSNYIFHQLYLKCSYTVVTKDVQKLCDFIFSESPETGETIEVGKIVTYLLSKGYTSKDIKEKFLIYLKSRDISYTKLRLLEQIDSDISLLLPLSSLPESILKLVAQVSRSDKLIMEKFSNRILYISFHLELEPHELIPALAKHSSLLTMNFNRLDDKMNILKNANISSKYIVKDLWIFNYNEQLLAGRIQSALKAGVELKPWMLRCSEKFFHSILIKYSETQRILDGETVHSYLAKKLDCSTDYIDYLMERNKLLKKINIPKLEQIIKFLYEKGYTSHEIRLFPRVFCSSLQTLERRLKEFQLVKSTLPTVAQLCMSKKKARSRLKS